jgi:predicted Zn-dependent peptidase
MSKRLKIMISLVAIVLIAAPVFFREKKMAINIVAVGNKLDIKTSLLHVTGKNVIFAEFVFKNAGVLQNSIDKHGISIVMSHLLLRRINNLSPMETQETFKDFGFRNLVVDASGEDLRLSFFVAKDNICKALEFLANAFANPCIASVDLQYIKSQSHAVLDPESSPIGSLLMEKVNAMLYPNSVYGLSRSGSSMSIANISTDDLADFLRTHLTIKNLEAIFVGDLARADVDSYLSTLFEKLPKEYNPAIQKLSCDILPEKIGTIDRIGMKDVAAVMVGIRIDDLTDLERAAIVILLDSFFDAKVGDFQDGLRKRNITHSGFLINYNGFLTMAGTTLSSTFYLTICLYKKDLQNYLQYLDEKIAAYGSGQWDKSKQGDLKNNLNCCTALLQMGFPNYNLLNEKFKLYTLPFDKITMPVLKNAAAKLFDPQRMRIALIKAP